MVPGVAEIVEVDAIQSGGGERRCPGSAAEVAVPEQMAARRGEDERVGVRSRVGVEVVLYISYDGARQDDAALACGGLRRCEERRLAASLSELTANTHGGGGGVDVTAAQRDDLAPAQAAEALSRIMAR